MDQLYLEYLGNLNHLERPVNLVFLGILENHGILYDLEYLRNLTDLVNLERHGYLVNLEHHGMYQC